MKSILISIQPKWCELIASGKKTVEVRKTKPKLVAPFKVYIYETKDKRFENIGYCWQRRKIFKHNPSKVIGEFVCGYIDEYTNYSLDEQCGHIKRREELLRSACMTLKGWRDYIGSCRSDFGYAWHISNLKIYDKPRELSEFYTLCYSGCDNCKYQSWDYGYGGGKDLICTVRNKKPITRPPQSWCYVEDLP